MIEVTKKDHRKIIVNAELITFIETTPDVVITLTTGTKILVCEDKETLIKKVIDYKAGIIKASQS